MEGAAVSGSQGSADPASIGQGGQPPGGRQRRIAVEGRRPEAEIRKMLQTVNSGREFLKSAGVDLPRSSVRLGWSSFPGGAGAERRPAVGGAAVTVLGSGAARRRPVPQQ